MLGCAMIGSSLSGSQRHPFLQEDRLFAHNGVIEDLPKRETELGDAMSIVHGQTDSERYFALMTREIKRARDVREGTVSASAGSPRTFPCSR